MSITSKNNQVYKLFQKLETKKYRDRTGLYLIEGPNLMEEALRRGVALKAVIVREDESERFAGLTAGAHSVLTARRDLFDKLSDTKTSQGIIAAACKPVFSREDFLACGAPGNFVVLDRLQDPGNVGTIVRTACAAGYALVIAMKGTADPFSPKAVRAAAGAIFRIPLTFAESEEELLRFTGAAGKKLAATCLDGGRKYYEEDLSRDIALVIGNEGQGVSPGLLEKAQLKINIPMRGQIESLNASVAAALIMYEAVRAAGAAKIQ